MDAAASRALRSRNAALSERHWQRLLLRRVVAEWRRVVNEGEHLAVPTHVQPMRNAIQVLASFRWISRALGGSTRHEFPFIYQETASKRIRNYLKGCLEVAAIRIPYLIHSTALLDAHVLNVVFTTWAHTTVASIRDKQDCVFVTLIRLLKRWQKQASVSANLLRRLTTVMRNQQLFAKRSFFSAWKSTTKASVHWHAFGRLLRLGDAFAWLERYLGGLARQKKRCTLARDFYANRTNQQVRAMFYRWGQFSVRWQQRGLGWASRWVTKRFFARLLKFASRSRRKLNGADFRNRKVVLHCFDVLSKSVLDGKSRRKRIAAALRVTPPLPPLSPAPDPANEPAPTPTPAPSSKPAPTPTRPTVATLSPGPLLNASPSPIAVSAPITQTPTEIDNSGSPAVLLDRHSSTTSRLHSSLAANTPEREPNLSVRNSSSGSSSSSFLGGDGDDDDPATASSSLLRTPSPLRRLKLLRGLRCLSWFRDKHQAHQLLATSGAAMHSRLYLCQGLQKLQRSLRARRDHGRTQVWFGSKAANQARYPPYRDPRGLRLLYDGLARLPARPLVMRRLLRRWRMHSHRDRLIINSRAKVLERRWHRVASAALGAWMLVFSRSSLLAKAAQRLAARSRRAELWFAWFCWREAKQRKELLSLGSSGRDALHSRYSQLRSIYSGISSKRGSAGGQVATAAAAAAAAGDGDADNRNRILGLRLWARIERTRLLSRALENVFRGPLASATFRAALKTWKAVHAADLAVILVQSHWRGFVSRRLHFPSLHSHLNWYADRTHLLVCHQRRRLLRVGWSLLTRHHAAVECDRQTLALRGGAAKVIARLISFASQREKWAAKERRGAKLFFQRKGCALLAGFKKRRASILTIRSAEAFSQGKNAQRACRLWLWGTACSLRFKRGCLLFRRAALFTAVRRLRLWRRWCRYRRAVKRKSSKFLCRHRLARWHRRCSLVKTLKTSSTSAMLYFQGKVLRAWRTRTELALLLDTLSMQQFRQRRLWGLLDRWIACVSNSAAESSSAVTASHHRRRWSCRNALRRLLLWAAVQRRSRHLRVATAGRVALTRGLRRWRRYLLFRAIERASGGSAAGSRRKNSDASSKVVRAVSGRATRPVAKGRAAPAPAPSSPSSLCILLELLARTANKSGLWPTRVAVRQCLAVPPASSINWAGRARREPVPDGSGWRRPCPLLVAHRDTSLVLRGLSKLGRFADQCRKSRSRMRLASNAAPLLFLIQLTALRRLRAVACFGQTNRKFFAVRRLRRALVHTLRLLLLNARRSKRTVINYATVRLQRRCWRRGLRALVAQVRGRAKEARRVQLGADAHRLTLLSQTMGHLLLMQRGRQQLLRVARRFHLGPALVAWVHAAAESLLSRKLYSDYLARLAWKVLLAWRLWTEKHARLAIQATGLRRRVRRRVQFHAVVAWMQALDNRRAQRQTQAAAQLARRMTCRLAMRAWKCAVALSRQRMAQSQADAFSTWQHWTRCRGIRRKVEAVGQGIFLRRWLKGWRALHDLHRSSARRGSDGEGLLLLQRCRRACRFWRKVSARAAEQCREVLQAVEGEQEGGVVGGSVGPELRSSSASAAHVTVDVEAALAATSASRLKSRATASFSGASTTLSDTAPAMSAMAMAGTISGDDVERPPRGLSSFRAFTDSELLPGPRRGAAEGGGGEGGGAMLWRQQQHYQSFQRQHQSSTAPRRTASATATSANVSSLSAAPFPERSVPTGGSASGWGVVRAFGGSANQPSRPTFATSGANPRLGSLGTSAPLTPNGPFLSEPSSLYRHHSSASALETQGSGSWTPSVRGQIYAGGGPAGSALTSDSFFFPGSALSPSSALSQTSSSQTTAFLLLNHSQQQGRGTHTATNSTIFEATVDAALESRLVGLRLRQATNKWLQWTALRRWTRIRRIFVAWAGIAKHSAMRREAVVLRLARLLDVHRQHSALAALAAYSRKQSLHRACSRYLLLVRKNRHMAVWKQLWRFQARERASISTLFLSTTHRQLRHHWLYWRVVTGARRRIGKSFLLAFSWRWWVAGMRARLHYRLRWLARTFSPWHAYCVRKRQVRHFAPHCRHVLVSLLSRLLQVRGGRLKRAMRTWIDVTRLVAEAEGLAAPKTGIPSSRQRSQDAFRRSVSAARSAGLLQFGGSRQLRASAAVILSERSRVVDGEMNIGELF